MDISQHLYFCVASRRSSGLELKSVERHFKSWCVTCLVTLCTAREETPKMRVVLFCFLTFLRLPLLLRTWQFVCTQLKLIFDSQLTLNLWLSIRGAIQFTDQYQKRSLKGRSFACARSQTEVKHFINSKFCSIAYNKLHRAHRYLLCKMTDDQSSLPN